MSDIFIFGFGVAVSIVIGSGLSTMIVIKNRALDAAERSVAPIPKTGGKPDRA